MLARTKKQAKPAQLLALRNKYWYLALWHMMDIRGKQEIVDSTGQTQYKSEVANILLVKYGYLVPAR